MWVLAPWSLFCWCFFFFFFLAVTLLLIMVKLGSPCLVLCCSAVHKISIQSPFIQPSNNFIRI
jgi:hypothetical protein